MPTVQIPVHLPRPHPKQADFIHSPAKRKVVVAGRRVGKTTGVSILCAPKCVEGRRILYAAPTQDQTDTFWENIKKYLAEGIASGAIYKNETKRLLELANGGRIRAKTAWSADTLRGDYADLLIMEEFEMMDVEAWDKVGAPMLLDNNGDAIFIGTPMRKNHFYQFFQRAVQDTSGRWQAWHFSSFDNPYLSKEALDELTADMSEEAFQQEILAKFLDDTGQVFRNLDACLNAPKNAAPEDHIDASGKKHRLVMGVDWGKLQDYTAVSIGCADCHVETKLDRFNQFDYSFQAERIKALFQLWQPATIMAESNSMGEPIIDQLRRDGLPVRSFQTTASSKPPLIEDLALAFERREWQWLPDPVGRSELEAYERKVSPATNRPTYSAPSGLHDDTVMARALMKRAAGQPLILFGA